MSTRHTVDVKAFGVTPERWHPDYLSAVSSYTERGPRPGTPVTTAALARLQPQLVGAQSVVVNLAVLSSGFPAQGGQQLGVGYYLAGETIADVRGWQAPTFFSDFQAFTSPGVKAPPPDGPMAFTTVPTVTNGAQTAFAFVPGTERLLAILPLAVYYSDDHGTTYTQSKTSGPASDISGITTSNTSRYDAAFDGAGNLLWVGQDFTANLTQFCASSDQGASWTNTYEWNPTGANNLAWDIAQHPDGTIALVYNDPGGASPNTVFFVRMGGAFESPADLDSVDVTGALAGPPSAVSIACEDNGSLRIFVTETGAPATVTRCYLSTDGGDTWARAADLWYANTTDELGPLSLVPSPLGGLAGAIGIATSAESTVVSAAVCPLCGAIALKGGKYARLGGWAGPGRNSDNWAESSGSRADMHYLGESSPVNYGMTLTGAATVGVSSGWRIQSTGAALQGYYQKTVYTADTDSASYEGIVQIEDDGGTTSAAPSAGGMGVRLQTNHAANNDRRTIIVYMDEGGYRVWDEEAAAWLGTKVSLDLASRRTYFTIELAESVNIPATWDVVTRHRQDETSPTKWVHTTWAGANNAATAASSAIARWGHLVGVANTISHWWRCDARGIGAAAITGYDQQGVGLGPYSYPIPDAHNESIGYTFEANTNRLCRLTLAGGPGFAREIYTVAPDHAYPIESSFPAVNPNSDRRWEANAASVAQSVLCDLHPVADVYPLGGQALAVALAVRNCNTRTVEIVAQLAAGGALVTIGTMNLATGFEGLSYVKAATGSKFGPNAAATGRYIKAGELIGGKVYIGALGALAYVITDNTAGFWSSTAAVPCTITVADDVTGLPNTGTISIAWPHGLWYYIAEGATAYKAWGWRVPAASAIPTGHTGARMGAVHLFGLRAPGKRWDHGWESVTTPNVRTERDERGSEWRSRRGPMRRTLTLSWDHGAKLSRYRGSLADSVEHLAPSGYAAATGLVVRDDVSAQLAGLYLASADGARPWLVIQKGLAAYPGAPLSTETITDGSLYFVGYPDSDLRSSYPTGTEGSSEYELTGPMRFVEAL